MKRFYITLALLMLSNALLFAQYTLPIYEPFQLAEGRLAGQNTWTGNTTSSTVGAQVVNQTLSYTGLPASKGYSVLYGNQTSGGTQALGFASQTTTVYASFLIQVSSFQLAAASSLYNFCFGSSITGGTFAGCMYVVRNVDGTTFELGFDGNNQLPTASNTTTQNFALNTTIMVVMAYTPNTTSGLGTVSAWVNPASSTFGSTAPTPTFSNLSNGKAATVASVLIRSGSATNPMYIDELRVGTSWADVTSYNVVLPVELADFSSKRKLNTTELSWSAYTEVDFDKYVVLHSKSGVDFNEIGSVKGKGNNSKYTFNYAHDGDAYFRLKSVDLNGQFEFSKVIYAKGNTVSIKAGPNPFTDKITISGMPQDGVNTIALYTLNGAKIKFQTANGSDATLALTTIPSGTYLLKIANGNRPVYSELFIK
jgi:hypothetical protein